MSNYQIYLSWGLPLFLIVCTLLAIGIYLARTKIIITYPPFSCQRGDPLSSKEIVVTAVFLYSAVFFFAFDVGGPNQSAVRASFDYEREIQVIPHSDKDAPSRSTVNSDLLQTIEEVREPIE